MRKSSKQIFAGVLTSILIIFSIISFTACDMSYHVIFETNGGGDVIFGDDDMRYSRSDKPNSYFAGNGFYIQESPTTTKEGFDFDGWYEYDDFSGDAITFPFYVGPNNPYTPGTNKRINHIRIVTLYAKWTEIANQ